MSEETSQTVFEAANRTRDAAEMVETRSRSDLDETIADHLSRVEDILRELGVTVQAREQEWETNE